jgi:hypothetical protein
LLSALSRSHPGLDIPETVPFAPAVLDAGAVVEALVLDPWSSDVRPP